MNKPSSGPDRPAVILESLVQAMVALKSIRANDLGKSVQLKFLPLPGANVSRMECKSSSLVRGLKLRHQ
ncbi:hypothetical protein TNCV_2948871 [Trichonephila clavipes]|nr:hypothetical protein TNCV_2948871 [Trichonephila clavipes]